MERRKFLGYTASAGAALMLEPFSAFALPAGKRSRLALEGTGHRGSGFWGTSLSKMFGGYQGRSYVNFNWYCCQEKHYFKTPGKDFRINRPGAIGQQVLKSQI